jgi:hypothetical protein
VTKTKRSLFLKSFDDDFSTAQTYSVEWEHGCEDELGRTLHKAVGVQLRAIPSNLPSGIEEATEFVRHDTLSVDQYSNPGLLK